MTLPALENWVKTRDSLHAAAQVLGALRKGLVEAQPLYLHLSLQVIPQGLTTGSTSAGEFILDFKQQTVEWKGSDAATTLTLSNYNQSSLMDAILESLDEHGHGIQRPDKVLDSATPLHLDSGHAVDYADALDTIHRATRQFWENLPGEKSPPVLWPHHFDLSCLWFASEKVSEEEPHMNFGFAPFSEGFDRPYFYAYAYPLPDGLTDLSLPPDARWHTTGWTGAVVDYDQLVGEDDPASRIEKILRQIFDVVSPTLAA